MFEDNGGMLEKEPFSLTRANYTKVGFNLLSVSPVTSLEGRGTGGLQMLLSARICDQTYLLCG